MIVEKFSEFSNKNNNKTIIDYIESILLNLYKGYSFKFASNGVFCFGKDIFNTKKIGKSFFQ